MATSSTLRLVHPEIGVPRDREVEISESRLRRIFRRRARRRALVPGWRDEAVLRGITRNGA